MSRTIRNLSMVMVLVVSAGLVGCNDPNQDMARDDQTMQELSDRIRDLENQLAQAEAQYRADQDQIDALRRELEQLRAQQANQGPAGWTGVPGGDMIEIEGTVLFDSGKANLRSTARQTLDEVVDAIRREFPEREIYVFGHTDTDPIRHSDWKDNYELSCERALSVVRYLQSNGVANYMAACGWGEHRPVLDNSSPEAKQANRRVEIFAMQAR